MSLLKRLFKGKSPDDWMAEADALFDSGAFGDAKLAYDRARDAAGDEALARAAQAKSDACCDALAERRIAEAERLAAQGALELAFEELREATETARGREVIERAGALRNRLEREDAVEAAQAPRELSEEERFAVIAGSWEGLQAEEMESYGEALAPALVALEDGRGEEARRALEALLEDAAEASYLWLELGRARLLTEDFDGARTALETFLARIGPEEGGAARLAAHELLAALHDKAGDQDAAVAQLEACCEALEDDARPYLALGNYLTRVGRAEEALEVLQLCAGMFSEGAPPWDVALAIGIAAREAGKREQAVRVLEAAVEALADRGTVDFPPPLAVTLAQLQEEAGDLTRAADLYRALATGSDVDNHFAYHREAARLLTALGLADEAKRMAERALALAGDDPEARAAVEAALAPQAQAAP